MIATSGFRRLPAPFIIIAALMQILGGCGGATTLPNGAASSAQTWLELIDTARYAESWDTSSSAFRDAISAASWAQAAQATREPLGKLESRSRANAETIKNPPGAPDGNYWFVTYTATFANKAEARETLTLLQEADGTWRVAGYFVK